MSDEQGSKGFGHGTESFGHGTEGFERGTKGFGHSTKGFTRVAAAGLTIALAALVSGCGVQPTGVNVADVVPFNASTSSSSLSAEPSQGSYPVKLYLFSKLNKGPGTMVQRMVPIAPGPMDLLSLVAEGSPYAEDGQYTSHVPPGITLSKTSAGHQYIISSPSPLSPVALQQLACTFDQYWLEHPDPNRTVGPTTRFIGDGLDTRWQDCSGELVPPENTAGGASSAAAAKAAVPSPAKSTTEG